MGKAQEAIEGTESKGGNKSFVYDEGNVIKVCSQ
jgi:hypothetical protein